MERRLKWLRLRLLKSARYHAMVGVTAGVVAVAAAAGLGAFDPDDAGRPSESRRAQAPRASPVAAPTTGGSQEGPVLTVTYVFVGSEGERAIRNAIEDTMIHREFLSRNAVEVLVVRDEEEEAAAYEHIDALRKRNPWNLYVVEDLRTE